MAVCEYPLKNIFESINGFPVFFVIMQRQNQFSGSIGTGSAFCKHIKKPQNQIHSLRGQLLGLRDTNNKK